jgi:hypothetical protein
LQVTAGRVPAHAFSCLNRAGYVRVLVHTSLTSSRLQRAHPPPRPLALSGRLLHTREPQRKSGRVRAPYVIKPLSDLDRNTAFLVGAVKGGAP